MVYHKRGYLEETDFVNEAGGLGRAISSKNYDESLHIPFYNSEFFEKGSVEDEDVRGFKIAGLKEGAKKYLSQKQYKVFFMHFFEGMRVTDLSRVMMIRKPTVTGYLREAIRKIRRKLKIFYLDKWFNEKTQRREYALIMGSYPGPSEGLKVIKWFGVRRPSVKAVKKIEDKYYEPYCYGRFKRV